MTLKLGEFEVLPIEADSTALICFGWRRGYLVWQYIGDTVYSCPDPSQEKLERLFYADSKGKEMAKIKRENETSGVITKKKFYEFKGVPCPYRTLRQYFLYSGDEHHQNMNRVKLSFPQKSAWAF